MLKLTTILIILGAMLYLTTCKCKEIPDIAYRTLSDLYGKYYNPDSWEIIDIYPSAILINSQMYRLTQQSLIPYITFNAHDSMNRLMYTGVLKENNELYLYDVINKTTLILTKSRLKCQSDSLFLLLP